MAKALYYLIAKYYRLHAFPVVPSRRVLEFLGRQLHVPLAAGPLAMFTFRDLCSNPLSAADYLEICSQFDTIFIRDIPRLTLQSRTEARRFITMIDTLYDHRVKLICSAEVPPEQLFTSSEPVRSVDAMVLTDDLDIQQVHTKPIHKIQYTVFLS